MENFDVIQTLIRTALVGNRDGVLQQTERLVERLGEAGDQEAARSLRGMLGRARRAQPSEPVTFSMSSVADGRLQKLGIRTPLPVDKESGVPLCEVVFPGSGGAMPILEAQTASAVAGLVEEWSHRETLAASGIPASQSLLLFGPPGTGKTTLARFLASELHLPAVVVRLDGLISSLLGSTAKNLASLFDFSNRYDTVLVLDEFDAVAKVRDDPNEVGEIKRVVNALLQNLDRRAGIGLTIGITNHDRLLDSAIWRRFEHQISLGMPGFSVRLRIAEDHMRQLALPPSLSRAVAWLSDGLSGADVRTLAVSTMKAFVLNSRAVAPVDILRLAVRGSGPRIGSVFQVLHEPDPALANRMSNGTAGFGGPELGELFGKDRRTIARWTQSGVEDKEQRDG